SLLVDLVGESGEGVRVEGAEVDGVVEAVEELECLQAGAAEGEEGGIGGDGRSVEQLMDEFGGGVFGVGGGLGAALRCCGCGELSVVDFAVGGEGEVVEQGDGRRDEVAG